MSAKQPTNPLPGVVPLAKDEVSSEESYQGVALYSGDVVLIRIRGSVCAGSETDKITARLSQGIADAPRDVTVFFDLADFTHYESQVRVRYTDALVKHGSKVKEIYVFADSRLVRMGASVAGLVLKQLRLLDRNTFDRLLRERLSRNS